MGGTAQNTINEVSSLAASYGINIDPGETIDVKFLVTGTFKDPRIRPVFEEGLKNVTEEVKEQVQEIVEEKIEEVKEEIREDVNREAEKITCRSPGESGRIEIGSQKCRRGIDPDGGGRGTTKDQGCRQQSDSENGGRDICQNPQFRS